MVEQLSECGPVNTIEFSEDELNLVAGIISGGRTHRILGNSLANSISAKMIGYEGLEETLRGVVRLPFTAEGILSEREREVYMLSLAGYSNAEIARVLGLTHRPITKYQERIEKKEKLQKDAKVPKINFENGSHSLWLIKAVHFVVSGDYQSFQRIPYMVLSPNESITLMWICTGRTDKEIAAVMETTPLTVRVYKSRASIKLGINGKFPLITATSAEIIRDREKAKAVNPV